MRKSIITLVAFAMLGSGYWIISSLLAARDLEEAPDISSAPMAPEPPANALPSPASSDAVTSLQAVETAAEHETHELDADGDYHAEQSGELQPLVEPPAVPAGDPDPVVGEVAALQEARSMVQALLAETDDPAAREEAEALLELIDSRQQ